MAFALTFVSMPFVVAVLRRRDVLDHPTHRSSHTRALPRGGGVAPAIVVTALVASSGLHGAERSGLLLYAAGLGMVGLVEDIRSVSATRRFAGQVVLTALAMPLLLHGMSGARVWQAVFVAGVLVWLTGFPNLFNFMDGINGITAAQVVVAGVAFYAAGHAAGVQLLARAGLVAAFAAAGFAPWNVPRAKVFPGDTGSYFFGGWLAALVVVGLRAGVTPEALFAPLGVALGDAVTTLVRRVVRGEVWHEAHREHAYQRLVQRGFSHAAVSATVLVVSGAAAWLGHLTIRAGIAERVVIDVVIVAIIGAFVASPALVGAPHPRRLGDLG